MVCIRFRMAARRVISLEAVIDLSHAVCSNFPCVVEVSEKQTANGSIFVWPSVFDSLQKCRVFSFRWLANVSTEHLYGLPLEGRKTLDGSCSHLHVSLSFVYLRIVPAATATTVKHQQQQVKDNNEEFHAQSFWLFARDAMPGTGTATCRVGRCRALPGFAALRRRVTTLKACVKVKKTGSEETARKRSVVIPGVCAARTICISQRSPAANSHK